MLEPIPDDRRTLAMTYFVWIVFGVPAIAWIAVLVLKFVAPLFG